MHGKFTYGRNSIANRLTDCGEVKEQATANVPLWIMVRW